MGLAYNFRGLVHCHGRVHGGMHADMVLAWYYPGEIAASFTSDLQAAGRERYWAWLEHLKPQDPPSASWDAILPNSYQVLLFLKEQAFKYMSLWQSFLFKTQLFHSGKKHRHSHIRQSHRRGLSIYGHRKSRKSSWSAWLHLALQLLGHTFTYPLVSLWIQCFMIVQYIPSKTGQRGT